MNNFFSGKKALNKSEKILIAIYDDWKKVKSEFNKGKIKNKEFNL